MKRLHKRFLLATFCTLFTATLQAADVTITVNGRVVAKPCTIQTKEANVNLGDLYTRNLQQPGSASGWHNITLSLTDCPIETSAVTAIVTGSTDNTGYYKNEGTAENIQIELRDDQDATLKNGDSKTVIYGMDDRYRGVFGQRDVVFMSAKQAKICRVKNGERVNLIALTPDGKRSSRRMDRLKVVIYPMADRSLVTYFPESNHMLTLDNHDPLSGIPGYKSIPVELEPSN